MTGSRLAAAALAALGAASAIPIPLAQLDFAGLWNVFDIDSGDSPRALHVIMGVGGTLTLGVLAVAFVGAALAGLVTAMPLWIPVGVVIGAAALIVGQSETDHRPRVPPAQPARETT